MSNTVSETALISPNVFTLLESCFEVFNLSTIPVIAVQTSIVSPEIPNFWETISSNVLPKSCYIYVISAHKRLYFAMNAEAWLFDFLVA